MSVNRLESVDFSILLKVRNSVIFKKLFRFKNSYLILKSLQLKTKQTVFEKFLFLSSATAIFLNYTGPRSKTLHLTVLQHA